MKGPEEILSVGSRSTAALVDEFPAAAHRADTVEAYIVSVERAIRHMKAHLDEPLDLDQLAGVAAISKFHLVRVFNEITGTTPHHFLAILRIQRAKELLLASEASITEVCMEVGYSSLGSFSQTFSELVGVSPKEFRGMLSQLTLRAFARAIRRWLAHDQCTPGPRLEGVIEAPPGPRGVIFVGTFISGVPQGVPLSGTVLLRPGGFRITRPSTPEFHLLAALIPFSAKLAEVVANLRVELVASQRLQNNGLGQPAQVQLRLRRMRATDPPIVVALPGLLR